MTPKQAIFIAEYLVDGNATRAALAAGVPEKGASVTGSRWLNTRAIAAVIAERQARRVEKLEITSERVLGEIAKLAFYDPANLFDDEGNMKPVHELDSMTRAAVASLEVEEKKNKHGRNSKIRKIKLADKGQNLERLGRYLKLFTDRTENDSRLTVESELTDGERVTKIAALMAAAKSRKNAK